jgi:hypothetical protein
MHFVACLQLQHLFRNAVAALTSASVVAAATDAPVIPSEPCLLDLLELFGVQVQAQKMGPISATYWWPFGIQGPKTGLILSNNVAPFGA